MTTHLPLVNDKTCSDCGGACCKNQPGVSSPEEWGAPDEEAMVMRLREAFATKRWAVDWWEGDPRPDKNDLFRGYFIRPAHVGHPGMHASWGGGPDCAFLTPKGCELAHDARPLGCRGLEPMKREGALCEPRYGTKHEMALAWVPYHDVLRRAGLLDAEYGDDEQSDAFSGFLALLSRRGIL